MGNEILRDDGIGPAVIRELKKTGGPPGVTYETTGLSGMPLLDLVTEYDNLIIVDALKSGKKTGEINWEQAEHFQSHTGASNQHRLNLFRVLELGNQLEMNMPRRVKVLTVSAEDVTSFGQYLSPQVAGAIPEAVSMIKHQIAIWHKNIQETDG